MRKLEGLDSKEWEKVDFSAAMETYLLGDIIMAEKDGWFKIFNNNISKNELNLSFNIISESNWYKKIKR